MNTKFNIDQWKEIVDRESIKKYISSQFHICPTICGPTHYFVYEFYRNIIENGLTDYELVPCDIFIWGKGCSPSGTQIGGLPNIPMDLWPKSEVDLSLLNFICQIDFSDSRDIVSVPKDYMLLFANFFENCMEEFSILWLDRCDLTQDCKINDSFLKDMIVMDPYYGEIHRTHNIVNRIGMIKDVKSVFRKNKIDFSGLTQILCADATMIGSYISVIQSEIVSSSNSEVVCKIHSLGSFSSQNHIYPWLNRKELDPDEMDSNSECNFSTFGRVINPKKFLIGDGGGIVIEKSPSGEFIANMYFYS